MRTPHLRLVEREARREVDDTDVRARALAAHQSAPRDTSPERRFEELAATMRAHYLEHAQAIARLEAEIEALRAQIAPRPSVSGNIIVSDEEWSTLTDMIENPPAVPEWLRSAVLRGA